MSAMYNDVRPFRPGRTEQESTRAGLACLSRQRIDGCMTTIQTAHEALKSHMARYRGEVIARGTFASEEFDRLYSAWICARWDAGDEWVRSVWTTRPEGGAV